MSSLLQAKASSFSPERVGREAAEPVANSDTLNRLGGRQDSNL